jgi:PhzF family phenazine biosynthesis protein
MAYTLAQVDAFTDRPFGGNPAAVCLLREEVPAAWMQSVAAEMNLAETAFVLPGEMVYQLRWFTPLVEVDLCGHATLASAHVLWEFEMVRPDEVIRFSTRSGELRAVQRDGLIWLDMPAIAVMPRPLAPDLRQAIGAVPVWEGVAGDDLMVELASDADVRALKPRLELLRGAKIRGLIVTAKSAGSEIDFVSRFFAPAVGIDEDPVTGSAHCALGPYWAQRLGKRELQAYQASHRGGDLRVRVDGERVFIGGKATTVLRGELL